MKVTAWLLVWVCLPAGAGQQHLRVARAMLVPSFWEHVTRDAQTPWWSSTRLLESGERETESHLNATMEEMT